MNTRTMVACYHPPSTMMATTVRGGRTAALEFVCGDVEHPMVVGLFSASDAAGESTGVSWGFDALTRKGSDSFCASLGGRS
ncbi:hypothetical protein QF047_004156 [Arthrobacter sp. W4I7]|nr:hypothetical protein [Arthrobacter sp. W4I7]